MSLNKNERSGHNPPAIRRWLPVTGLAIALAAVTAMGAQRAGAELPARLKITSIGTLNGMQTFANGVNDAGVVVGYAAAVGSHVPVRWSNGTLTELPAGTGGGVAIDINNQDEIVGHVGSTRPQVVLFRVNGPQELNTVGAEQSFAGAINDLTQVVGWYRMPGSETDLPFLWQDGTMAALALPTNMQSALALGISNSGYVAGQAIDGDGLGYPVRWSQALEPEFLRGPNGEVINGYASGVNDAGDVAGAIFTDHGPDAVVWRNGQMIQLNLPNTLASYTTAVNNLGQALVSAFTADSQVIYLWEDLNGNGQSDAGEAVDVSTLLPQPNDWRLVQSAAISDNGHIAGSGRLSGSNRGFVLTPAGPAAPDLRIELSAAPTPARVGQELTFTVTVRNQGEAAATNVAIVAKLPATVDFVSGDPNPHRGSNGELVFGFDSLAVQGSGSVSFVVRPKQTGEAPFDFLTISQEQDQNPADNSLSMGLEVLEALPAGPDLGVTVELERLPARVGQALAFNYTVKNHGEAATKGAVLVVGPLENAKFLDADAKYKVHRGHYSFKLGSLAAGATKSVTFVVRPTEVGSLTLGAFVSSDEKEANLHNNSVETSLTVEGPAQPDLTVSLGEITPSTVGKGRKKKSALAMPVTVSNVGAAAVKLTSRKKLVVAYYFSTDAQLDSGDLQLGTSSLTRTMQAYPHRRSSATATIKVALPAGFDPTALPEGYILAKVDSAERIAESNEENNVGSRPLVITAESVRGFW